jgi:hypothetical protein
MKYVTNTINNLFIGVPIAVATSSINTLKTIVGITVSAASALSFGSFIKVNYHASTLTYKELKILTDVYYSVIKVINPNFDPSKCLHNLPSDSIGIITRKIGFPIERAAYKTANSKNCLSKYGVSRVLYALNTIVSTITRIADLAIGLVAAALSIIPCVGRSEALNIFTIQHLTLRIIQGICSGVRYTMNPQLKISIWNKENNNE